MNVDINVLESYRKNAMEITFHKNREERFDITSTGENIPNVSWTGEWAVDNIGKMTMYSNDCRINKLNEGEFTNRAYTEEGFIVIGGMEIK